MWISLKQETVSGNGMSWAICKSAPSCRTDNNASQFFSGRMPLLPPSQQHQSTEGKNYSSNNYKIWLSVPFVVEKSVLNPKIGVRN